MARGGDSEVGVGVVGGRGGVLSENYTHSVFNLPIDGNVLQ